jgi:RecA-family ATPase
MTVTDFVPKTELSFIDLARWDHEPVPPREWAVQERIPLRQPTLFSGDGGKGKTRLLLQLSCAHALGKDWLGLMPEPGPAIYLGAEDDEDELHRVVAGIAAHYGASFADLAGNLHLLSLAGKDALLAVPDRNDLMHPTPLFESLKQAACDIRPKLIGLDTASDVFGGQESNRSQVRQFVSMLRQLAITSNSAVILNSHPSLTGMSSGSGLSGSTAWHNSVRARMYLTTASTDKGEEPDPDLRELQFMKNNYGPVADKITLRWRNGLFVPEQGPASLNRMAQDQKAEEVFLALLQAFEQQGRNVSHHPTAPSYAAAMFCKEPAASGLRKEALAGAMRRLFTAGKIHVETYGRPSRPLSKIARGAAQEAA